MNLHGHLPGILLLGASLAGLFFTVLCLRDGIVLNRGFIVDRARKPRLYWLFIALYLAFSAILFRMAFAVFLGEV
jgi:hypothetical protein